MKRRLCALALSLLACLTAGGERTDGLGQAEPPHEGSTEREPGDTYRSAVLWVSEDEDTGAPVECTLPPVERS